MLYYAYGFNANDANSNLLNISFLNDSAPAGKYVVYPDTAINKSTNHVLSCIVDVFTQNGSHFYISTGKPGDSVTIGYENGKMKAALKNISLIDSSNSIVTVSANLYSQQ